MSEADERWDRLSGFYAVMQDQFREDHFFASQIARVFRIRLTDYLGGGPDSVVCYTFDEKEHAYSLASKEFRAISLNQDSKWVLGYGITLERSPTAYPKTTFQFPVWINWDDTHVTVDTSFGVSVSARQDTMDFSEACKLIYDGLCTGMQNQMIKKVGGSAFGFIEFNE